MRCENSLPMGDLSPYAIIADLLEGTVNHTEEAAIAGDGAHLKMLISPHMVVSLETSPISMKYLHN